MKRGGEGRKDHIGIWLQRVERDREVEGEGYLNLSKNKKAIQCKIRE